MPVTNKNKLHCCLANIYWEAWRKQPRMGMQH